MFGVSISFTDSIAYMTDVQQIDSASVWYNGFLADRTLYGLQLDHYMENTMHMNHNTSVVFFNEKKGKLEKKYMKVRKKINADKGLRLQFLGRDRFAFTAEEYVPSTVEVVPTQQTAPQQNASMPHKKKGFSAPWQNGGGGPVGK